jgi:serine/threonine protein phosphatase PrpC
MEKPQTKRNDYFGASVVGPRHRAESKPNEDSWLGARGSFGTLIVVSDGMGSRREARRGAKMACRAVLAAVRAWHQERSNGIDALLPKIEAIWLECIAPSQAHDCAATCLFALAHSGGTLYVAGLGDGLAMIRGPHGCELIVGRHIDGFSNETDAIGESRSWAARSFPQEPGNVVLLATDGVADDLIQDRLGDFVKWLMDDFAALAPARRWHALRRELASWPTPHHSDDKTLAVLAHHEPLNA